MDSTTSFQSEYLQARLREKKAEAARSARLASRNDSIGSRRAAGGRDDDVLDLDDSPTSRKANGRPSLQTSPPTSYRHDDRDERNAGRRASAVVGNTPNGNGTPRGMGVRQMEEQVDKLGKQNFDLKMEVHHLREKLGGLEKKLWDVPKLEDEIEELAEMNEVLAKEVEQRDRAVDEAVAIICDLEERNRRLQDALRKAREQSSKGTLSAGAGSFEARSRPSADRPRTPTKISSSREARHTKVSSDVSARIADLASPSPKAGRKLPSFLTNHEPSTDALRRLFVDGDQPIRPVRSQASLLSASTTKDDDNVADDILSSPRLSVLSLSELKSLYGQDESSEQSPKEQNSNVDASLEQASAQERVLRTNRWVVDRAVSPTQQRRALRQTGPDVGQFQSLGGVLNQEVPLRDYVNVKSDANQVHSGRGIKYSETPPLGNNGVFDHHMFPPTPDTMQTRPSNHSSSSIAQDKYAMDTSGAETIKVSHTAPLHPSAHSASRGRRARDGDFRDDSRHRRIRKQEAADPGDDFGASLFRADSQEENSHPDLYKIQAPRSGQRLFDGEDAFAPARNSPGPPRLFGSRRRSIDLPDFTSQTLAVDYFSSTAASLQDRSFPRQSTDGTLEALSLATAPHARPHGSPPSKRIVPSSYQPLVRSNTTNSSCSRTMRFLGRGASIRNQVAKLTRRNSASTTNSDGAHNAIAPAGRRNSITQRFRFRRNSSVPANDERPGTASEYGPERGASSLSFATSRSVKSSGTSNSAQSVPATAASAPKANPEFGTKSWAEGGAVGAPNLTATEDRRPGTARPGSKNGPTAPSQADTATAILVPHSQPLGSSATTTFPGRGQDGGAVAHRGRSASRTRS